MSVVHVPDHSADGCLSSPKLKTCTGLQRLSLKDSMLRLCEGYLACNVGMVAQLVTQNRFNPAAVPFSDP